MGRWEQNNWNPQRLKELLPVLGEIAYPVEWTSEWRRTWAGAFEERREDLTDYVTKELAFQVIGETLLKVTPAMAQGVVAAIPYSSIEEAEKPRGGRPSSASSRRGQVLRTQSSGAYRCARMASMSRCGAGAYRCALSASISTGAGAGASYRCALSASMSTNSTFAGA